MRVLTAPSSEQEDQWETREILGSFKKNEAPRARERVRRVLPASNSQVSTLHFVLRVSELETSSSPCSDTLSKSAVYGRLKTQTDAGKKSPKTLSYTHSQNTTTLEFSTDIPWVTRRESARRARARTAPRVVVVEAAPRARQAPSCTLGRKYIERERERERETLLTLLKIPFYRLCLACAQQARAEAKAACFRNWFLPVGDLRLLFGTRLGTFL